MSLTVLYNVEYSAYTRSSEMALLEFLVSAPKEFANENRDF